MPEENINLQNVMDLRSIKEVMWWGNANTGKRVSENEFS